jgi:sigma54-dependent transcription regulator
VKRIITPVGRIPAQQEFIEKEEEYSGAIWRGRTPTGARQAQTTWRLLEEARLIPPMKQTSSPLRLQFGSRSAIWCCAPGS